MPPKLELWRILTAFTWAGPGTMVDFPVIMLLYSMVAVVPAYEKEPHEACYVETEWQRQRRLDAEAEEDTPTNNEGMRDRIVNRWTTAGRSRPRHRQSDCIFAFLCCSILILMSHFLLMETPAVHMYIHRVLPLPPPILLPIFTRTLMYSIITLHSLKHPDQQQNINFFPVPGRYVPLFHVAFGVMMGYRINETAHGIAVGLIYDQLVKEDGLIARALGRKRVLFTPQFIIHLAGEEGMTMTQDVMHNANQQEVVRLEPGANMLHHASASGDVLFIQNEINRVESLSSASEIAAATAPFRQPDRNGWQVSPILRWRGSGSPICKKSYSDLALLLSHCMRLRDLETSL